MIYTLLPDESFILEHDPGKSSLNFGEGMWVSVNSQSLLGMSGVSPKSTAARGLIATQCALTLLMLINLAYLAVPASLSEPK